MPDNDAADSPHGTGSSISEQPQAAPRLPTTTEEQIQEIYIGGMAPLVGRIQIDYYNPEWPKLFEREATRIRAALGDQVVLLEHVGSTSVPGLAAKPRIDILLIVPNSADESNYVPALEAVGYVLCIREPDWHEHRVFKEPDNVVYYAFFVPTTNVDGKSNVKTPLVFSMCR